MQEDITPLINIIKSFRLTLNNIKIYPQTSSLVETPFNELTENLQKYLENHQMLTFAELNSTLLVEGIVLNVDDPNTKLQMNEFARTLKQKDIHSITFKAGLTKEELRLFLDSFAKKKPNIKTKDFLEEIFSEKKVQNIAIDQVEYMPVVKTDSQVSEIFNQLSQPAGDMPHVMSSLGKIYKLMDDVKDESLYEKIQERVANYLANLDISLLKEFLEGELPSKIEKTGIKDNIVSAFTKDRLEEIFREVLKWCNELKNKGVSEAEYLTQLSGLKNFLQKFLQSPSSKLVSVELYDELFQAGAIDQMPGWAQEAKQKKVSILFQIDTIIEKDSITLLESSTLGNLPDAVEKLCQLDLTDTLQKLVGKMLENFNNTLPKLRQLTAETVKKIFEILVKFRQDKILVKSLVPVLDTTEKENEQNVYTIEFKILFNLAEYFTLSGRYEQSKNVIQLLKKITLREYTSDENKINISKDTLNEIFSKTKHVFLADLVSSDIDKQALSTWFIITWGEDSVEALINILKETEDIRSRIIIANLFKTFSDRASKEIMLNLNLGLPAKQLKNIIEILYVFDRQYQLQFINAIEKIMFYASPQIKRNIVHYLSRVNIPESKQVMLGMLSKSDELIQQEIIAAIYETQFVDASDELISILFKAGTEVQKEICTVLGNLKIQKAIPSLIKILKGRQMLFGLIKGVNPEVRIRACWALGNFKDDKEARKSIEWALSDRNTALRNFAREVMKS